MNRLLTAVALLLLFGCNHSRQQLIEDAPLITRLYKDDLDREIKLSRTPSRVVSLAPSCTEMLYAIGAETQVVGCSDACDYPTEVSNIPSVTTYPSLDLPAIAELDPDFVLATTEIIDVREVAFFERYGIPLYFQDFSSTEDIYRNLEVLGDILNHKEEAYELTASLEKYEEIIVESAKSKVRYRTMILIGVEPLLVAGTKSFISEIIEKAGGVNAFEGLNDKYPVINQEAVLSANPEVILIPSTNEQIYQNFANTYPLLHLNTIASQNGRVYLVDPNLVLRPGPRTIQGMAIIAKTIHPSIDLTEITE